MALLQVSGHLELRVHASVISTTRSCRDIINLGTYLQDLSISMQYSRHEHSHRGLFLQGLSLKFFRRVLKGWECVPRVLVTSKLGSYGVAKREALPPVEHRRTRYLNNWTEDSQQPTRRRQRVIYMFKSAAHAQRFVCSFGRIREHFSPRWRLLQAGKYRAERLHRFQVWHEVTRVGADGQRYQRQAGPRPSCFSGSLYYSPPGLRSTTPSQPPFVVTS